MNTVIHVGDTSDRDCIVLYISPDELEVFRTLMQRALNTWQEPPRSMRDLKDKLERL